MKILYTYKYCNFGGVSTVIRERVKSDLESTHQVIACYRQDAGGVDQLKSAGVQVHISNKYVDTAIGIGVEEEVDSFHLVDEADYLPKIRASYPGQIVLEMHSSNPTYLNQVTDKNVKHADLVLVPSEWSMRQLANRLSQASLNKCHVLPNITLVPQPKMESADNGSGRPNILWVGKLDDGKNWADALRIYKRVNESVACDFLMVTGGGVNKDATNRFVSELHSLGVKVNWSHNVSRETMSTIYSATRESGGALLVTSLAESFGLVVVEALVHGVPVFCSRTHALPELVAEGTNGFTFPVGNTTEVAGHLRKLFEQEQKFDSDAIVASTPKACYPTENFELFENTVVRNCTAERKKFGLKRVFEHKASQRHPAIDVFEVR